MVEIVSMHWFSCFCSASYLAIHLHVNLTTSPSLSIYTQLKFRCQINREKKGFFLEFNSCCSDVHS